MKNKWINSIKDANEINYNGCGFICYLHFNKKDFEDTRSNQKLKLKKNAIPTVFLIKAIESQFEFTDIHEISNHCTSCEELKRELFKLNADHDVQILKSTDKINVLEHKMTMKINDIKAELKDALAVNRLLLKENKRLEVLLAKQTSIAEKTKPNVNDFFYFT